MKRTASARGKKQQVAPQSKSALVVHPSRVKANSAALTRSRDSSVEVGAGRDGECIVVREQVRHPTRSGRCLAMISQGETLPRQTAGGRGEGGGGGGGKGKLPSNRGVESYDTMPWSKKLVVLSATFAYALLTVLLLSMAALPPFLEAETRRQQVKGALKVTTPISRVLDEIRKKSTSANFNYAASAAEAVLDTTWIIFMDSNRALFMQLRGAGVAQVTPQRRAAFSLISAQRGQLEVEVLGWPRAMIRRLTRGVTHLFEARTLESFGTHVIGCCSLNSEMACPGSLGFVEGLDFDESEDN